MTEGGIIADAHPDDLPGLLGKMLRGGAGRRRPGGSRPLADGARGGPAFAALILDLTIPGGMGGREVAAEIRAVDAVTPLCVASGYADDATVAEPGSSGFTASIAKPFRRDDLMEMLEKHLGRRAGAAP